MSVNETVDKQRKNELDQERKHWLSPRDESTVNSISLQCMQHIKGHQTGVPRKQPTMYNHTKLQNARYSHVFALEGLSGEKMKAKFSRSLFTFQLCWFVAKQKSTRHPANSSLTYFLLQSLLSTA
jgi:hypothetical protein